MYTAEITPKPATVQIIRDTNQDIKSVIVQCDRHLKTTVLWWQLGRGREMLLLCFGWETETYCKLKRFSRELPVHLPFEDPIPQGRWCAGCDGPDSPRRVLYLLYKALTQKNKWDMLHEAHHLEQVRSVRDKLSRFLSDWETKEDDNRKPTVPDKCAAPATAEGPTAVRKCDHEERGMHVPTPTAFIQTTQQGFGRTRDALPSQMSTSLLFFVEFMIHSWRPPPSQPATNQTSRCWGENWCRFPEAPQGDCPH